MNFREGDFIESNEGLIFDVKGLIHPPKRVIAFVRYIPSLDGDRERKGIKYRKIYDLDERFAFLRKALPQYLVYDPVLGEEMMEVPVEQVAHHYSPPHELATLQANSTLTPLEEKALEFIDLIIDSTHIPQDKIGISGSLLVKLASPSSDLDVIVYGETNTFKVNLALKNHFEEQKRLKRHSAKMLRKIYKNRCSSSGISFTDFTFHEQRKSFQGFFDETEFFLRYVRDWDEFGEVYGGSVYSPVGRATIWGNVTDDSDAFFTPCSYLLDNVKVISSTSVETVSSIVSFRGRFCQQALAGERVLACGKLERVVCSGRTSYRLVLGNNPEDFMVSVR